MPVTINALVPIEVIPMLHPQHTCLTAEHVLSVSWGRTWEERWGTPSKQSKQSCKHYQTSLPNGKKIQVIGAENKQPNTSFNQH